MSKVAVIGLVASLGVVGGTGCGDGGESAKQRYERQFRAVLVRTQAQSRYLSNFKSLTNAGTARGVGSAFERLRTLTFRMADQLSRLKPPTEVREAHAAYVAGIRAFVDGPIRAAFRLLAEGRKNDATAALEHPSRRYLNLLLRMKAARDEFRAKGYDLGPAGGPLP